MQAEVLTKIPNELKTIEIDTEKKIFKINGEDFGRETKGFLISCSPNNPEEDWFSIGVRLNTSVHFVNYDINGKKTGERSKEKPPKI